jgi:putative nucleotidyltransferase with HDIG domain
MVAHRYFSKPFDPMALTEAVKRLSETRQSATNEKVREYVGKIDALPTQSQTYLHLTKALGSASASIHEISNMIAHDPALTSKVLQTVNSAMFGPARRITSVMEAVQLIGFQVLRALVLGIQVFDFFQNNALKVSLNQLWAHSLDTALRAKRLSALEDMPDSACDEAFLSGLLHDIGKVALAASSPHEYQRLWAEHRRHSRALREAESREFGATHAEVGAYLLKLWGLPETIIEAVELHHKFDPLNVRGFSPLLAVFAAQELSPERGNDPQALDLLEEAGFGPRIRLWRAALEHAPGDRLSRSIV